MTVKSFCFHRRITPVRLLVVLQVANDKITNGSKTLLICVKFEESTRENEPSCIFFVDALGKIRAVEVIVALPRLKERVTVEHFLSFAVK